ncbi:TlpA disulfide reductase family protein [Stutzerimonas kirkiae]|uniref:Peroxiredoxin n=1 Tax=Stutzerimonas kirkiae TaxID=2211392 RepID=A0A4Q9RFD0_9GAMM|nr:TlpA disulfide reductase family protein [Stutzerimonas kirkiae]TBU99911.1 peroxiredoxin [Stutzerimonas kirkiae]TBV05617.1 peroxiredoxin [Stutzerimonas kirkiae]TBV10642.1 peroxiredoxin [Stutzerimonas kirkiae]TBV17497.1 peroxiredoxin [Stutzerimonas kirkiae]
MSGNAFKGLWFGAALLLSACGADWGPDQHGRTVESSELEGRWLLVNYWAEWCGPCRTEIPELNELAAADTGLQVLGVNFDGLQGDELSAAAQVLGIEFTVLGDDPSERLQLPRSEVLPVSYLIDDKGALRRTLVGEQTRDGILGIWREER